MNQINVSDKTITTTRVVKSIEIDSIEVKINESAVIKVKQLDETGGLISIDRVTMDGTDYANWSNDDQYVVDFVLEKLGLTEL